MERIRSGKTGAIIPKATMSAPTMIRMKAKAARPGFADESGEGAEAKDAPEWIPDCRLTQHAAPVQMDRTGRVLAGPQGRSGQISRMTGRIRGRLEVCLLM